ncbi:hypothetical protein HUX88_04440 [Duganella sp. BJB1802]|uniref:hypothetical protein n=1 Tax=Duganella sp. BJB1802 TaxID=2744575 RepID=UPI0015944477|nr:hypothetical protein [Duganella sp. BJB1802]NVD69802.1 hypothetical protein [Duganella sp. BJB1802]
MQFQGKIWMIIRTIFFILLSAIFISGCNFQAGDFYQDRLASEDATHRLRKLYNEQRFSEIYDLGTPQMRESVSREVFVQSATESYARFGQFKKATEAGTACLPLQVRLVYLSEYEKGKVTEKLAWAMSHGRAELIMFNISEGYAPPTEEIKNQCPS